jgi:hypothetical protein
MTELVGGANATEDTMMVDENARKDLNFRSIIPMPEKDVANT